MMMLLTPPDSSTNRYSRKQQQMPSMLDTSGNGNLGKEITLYFQHIQLENGN